MSETRLFQYATSTDPAVLEVIQANQETYEAWRLQVHAWATEMGSEDGAVHLTGWGGKTYIHGLPKEPEGHGRWTPGTGSVWRPYKRNPEYARMSALVHTSVPVPGVPSMLTAPADDGWSTVMMTPHPFVFEGAAWVGVSRQPQVDTRPHRDDQYGPQWSEALASAYHLAREGYNAAAKAAHADS